MQKFSIISVSLTLLMFCATCFWFVKYDIESYREFQERKADLAVNYAVDAAVDALIEFTPDLSTDYADFERITVDPEEALNMFITVYMRNWNMFDTKENRMAIRVDNIPCFMVAGYDGYYIGTPTVINSSGARDIVFDAKRPYLYKQGDDLYGLNLFMDDARKFDGTKISTVEPVPISKYDQAERISTLISDSIMKAIYENREGDVMSSFYVPSQLTALTKTNPIQNVTVMAYVDDIFVGGGEPIEVFGIGGARTKHIEFYGGYIRDGYKYYAPMKLIPKSITVLEVFESTVFAAQNGYYQDLMYWEW